ncbi:MAG: prenyltransferase [Acidobacteria bacterium]|nr:prenyltransferase [Acidobacteriota bacterium]
MAPASISIHDSDFWQGVYRLADPKITLASAASMFVGACAAAAHGDISWSWFAITAFGIVCIEAAKNASGEIFDWDSGTDQAIQAEERTPFSGGKRVIVEGLLSRRTTGLVAAVFYFLGGSAGMLIVVVREPSVIWLGLAGAALAFFYHAPPLGLVYRGFGELAVAISYGPIIASGTYLVQRGNIGRDVTVTSAPLGLAIVAFLWINEFPDSRADALAGKPTLVVRLGHQTAAIGFTVIIATASAMVVALPALGLPRSIWLGLAGLPFGIAAARRLRRVVAASTLEVENLVAAQGWKLMSFLLMALGLGAGSLVGG